MITSKDESLRLANLKRPSEINSLKYKYIKITGLYREWGQQWPVALCKIAGPRGELREVFARVKSRGRQVKMLVACSLRLLIERVACRRECGPAVYVGVTCPRAASLPSRSDINKLLG